MGIGCRGGPSDVGFVPFTMAARAEAIESVGVSGSSDGIALPRLVALLHGD